MSVKLKSEFINFAKIEFGEDMANKLCHAIEQTEPEVSIRVNPIKIQNESVSKSEKVGWTEYGYYLNRRPLFTMDPLFHAGAYYVQEASSMFVEQVFRQYILPNSSSPRVLDLCAAPGGKSTHILSLLNGNGFVLSNEIVRSRAKVLCENIAKWGYHNCAVSNNSSSEVGEALRGTFDVVVIDAPCSGEGMFRKDEEAIKEWSEENVKMCAARQREILASIVPSLKSDGILIYSTCTYNKYEDEETTDFIENVLGLTRLRIEVNPEWNILENNYGYHFFPHKTKGEGFFLSAFIKNSDEESFSIRVKKDKKAKRQAVKTPTEVLGWLNNLDVEFIGSNVVPSGDKDFVQYLIENLHIMQYGVSVYESKGKDLIPQHHLAISSLINREAFVSEDVDWETAIKFLKKENIPVSTQEKGWVLITFRGVPLGFVKQVGGRTNNAYPQNWRILMTPDASKYEEIV